MEDIMKTLLTTAAAALAFAALSGCATVAPSNVAPGAVQGSNGALGVLPTERTASLVGHLSITGPEGYRIQTLTAWNLNDIDHVKLTLSKGGATVATKTIARAALSQAVTLSNLRMATGYKIVAQAYADAAEATEIDNTAEAGSDAANAVSFTTPSLVTAASGDNVNDSTVTLTIPVKLKNKTFAGTANSGTGVAVTNGTIINTGNTETF
jgi:hypothetical protein